MLCREQVAQLREREPAIADLGARLVVIGSGAPPFIPPFREITKLRGEILTDPKRVTFEALQFTRSPLRLLDPRVLVAGIKTLWKGFRQGKTQGHPFQNGGVLIVLPQG